MRLLGIDPGLRHTGWGIINTNDDKIKSGSMMKMYNEAAYMNIGGIFLLWRGIKMNKELLKSTGCLITIV